MNLDELYKGALAALNESGFVGMDFNMAVLCICAKRTGQKVEFAKGRVPATGLEPTYEAKLEYWASKYRWHYASEDDILKAAEERYHACPKCGTLMRKMDLLRWNSGWMCPECNYQSFP